MASVKELFFINNPVFVKFKRKFNWKRFRKEEALVKFVFINERILEIPFVATSLGDMPAGSTVIDLGCSESMLPMFLLGMGFEVTGVDCRDYPYDMPRFHFERADILKLPYADGAFDAATCISTVEHIGLGHYMDPLHETGADGRAMEQIRRVLKPGGRLIFSVPFGKPFQGSLQRVYDRPRLDAVFKGFRIEKIVFHRVVKKEGAINNFWELVSESQAAEIPGSDKTECVCLIKASKV